MRTRIKLTTLLIVCGMLFLIKIALAQAGLAAAEGIEDAPTWLAPTLLALANIAGAGLVLGLVVMAVVYGRDIYAWLQSLLDGDGQDAPTNSPQDDKPQAITRDLYRTVVGLERHGSESGELVTSATSQTLALVEICKQLQRRAAEHAEITYSLAEALKAVTSGDPLKIKEAAGAVRDQHISGLMLLSSQETDPEYWESVSGLIATQLGAARRWQTEYRKLAGALIGEVAGIKVRLMAVTANLEVAEAGRPLLEAKVNLENAGRILRAPVHEAASPTRLFAPQNEYQLPERSVKR